MIEFYSIDIDYKLPFDKNKLLQFLRNIAEIEESKVSGLTYIFTSNTYLLEINKQFLNHNYFTDVITFNSSNFFGLNGEIYISVEYIKANYMRYSLSFRRELLRGIIHGLLHLIGYDDDNAINSIIMRNRENHYLGLF